MRNYPEMLKQAKMAMPNCTEETSMAITGLLPVLIGMLSELERIADALEENTDRNS